MPDLVFFVELSREIFSSIQLKFSPRISLLSNHNLEMKNFLALKSHKKEFPNSESDSELLREIAALIIRYDKNMV